MKKLIYLFVLTTFISSCSSDSKIVSTPVDEVDMLGTWYLKEVLFEDGSVDNTSNEYIQILENHKIRFVYPHSGTHGENVVDTGTWSLSGNTFKVDFDDVGSTDIFTAQILSIDWESFKWTWYDDVYKIVETYKR